MNNSGKSMVFVYVAGASSEIPRVQKMIRALYDKGIYTTYDWTVDVLKAGAANAGLTHAQRESAWYLCLDGVMRADTVIVLAPLGNASTRGAWGEMGVATLLRKSVLYVGSADDTIMSAYCTTVSTDLEAVVCLTSTFKRLFSYANV